MPYTRFPPSIPPRGGRRNWVEELTLPTRLELYAHGLVERKIATYGFVVWDVGENRLLQEHGAIAAKGPEATPLAAGYTALIEGLGWLVRHGHRRRRIVAYSDNVLVCDQLSGGRPVHDGAQWQLVREGQRIVRLFSQLSLKSISEQVNDHAVGLAAGAYVAAQEEQRLQRVPAVLRELRRARPDIYLVGDRYQVDLAAGTCTCPDFRTMHSDQYPIRCKHLLAALQQRSSPAPDS